MEKLKLNVTNLLIKENLISDYEEYYLNINDYSILFIKIVIFMNLISYCFYNNILLVILFFPFCIIFPFTQKEILKEKRNNKLLLEFKDFLSIIKSFLDASYSIENAFLLSIKELKMLYGENGMMVKELLEINNKVKMNKPVQIAFKEFADKTNIADIKDFSEVFVLIKNSGGNINKIIKDTINIINEKIDIQIQIKTMTTEKKFEQNIMNFMPFIIIIYLKMTSNKFLMPLYNSFSGIIIMSILFIIYLLSIYLSNKILDIKI